MLEGTLLYGLVNSAVLVLMAMGFNPTFGISGVSNFAYGAIYILAGYLAWIFLNTAGLPYPLAAALAVASAAALGALLYRFVILRVRGLILSEVMATFGIGLIILELFRYLGFVGFRYTLPVFLDGSVALGEAYVDCHRLAFRGIAQNEETALTLGIDSDRVATWSVAFGAGLAAFAAVTILPLGTIAPEGGYDVLVQALSVCIVGGMASTVDIVLAGSGSRATRCPTTSSSATCCPRARWGSSCAGRSGGRSSSGGRRAGGRTPRTTDDRAARTGPWRGTP